MDSFSLFIFGITGNLAQLKIIPSLYDLAAISLLPDKVHIVGVGRRGMSQDDFRSFVWDSLHIPNRNHMHDIKESVWRKLRDSLGYIEGEFDKPDLYQKMANFLTANNIKNQIFYLATYPKLYEQIFHSLKNSGLSDLKNGWTRLMIDKPIGSDFATAQKLNQLLANYFSEDQIYRLDHYLGKETLQNILTFRFGNGIFEPLMNHDHIENIQITAAEEYGIGRRGGYYDLVGATRDWGQNHLLQMLTAVTMDAPAEFSNAAVTKERIKILEALKPNPTQAIFGQYDGYLSEANIDPASKTDTYFATKLEIANERFAKVPIYLRTGKKLAETVTEISIEFKVPVNRLFGHLDRGHDPNVLVFRIQPNEGIVLRVLAKTPGHTMELEQTYMQFCYKDASKALPDAYERLLADCFTGDQTFFNDAAEVEAQWKFIDPLLAAKTKPVIYAPGSWGPPDTYPWLTPSPIFCNII